MEQISKIRDILRDSLGTPAGEELANYLKAQYVDVSSLGNTPEHTAYRLGQKELVQDLLRLSVMTDEEIQAIAAIGSER